MQRFVEFNAARFLKESRDWEKKKERLYRTLDEIPEVKGIDNSPIRSGRLHDSVSDIASEREHILNRIKQIEFYESVLAYVKKRLSQEQLDVLDAFFFKRGYINKNVYELCKKYATNYPKGAYEMRRDTLDEVSRIITEKFL